MLAGSGAMLVAGRAAATGRDRVLVTAGASDLRLRVASKRFARSGLFYALGHYSRTFGRGDRIVPLESDAGTPGIAARRMDGSVGLVLYNPGPARLAAIELPRRFVRLRLPADSVVSVVLA